MEINISIGERLREEREGLGKTQGDFASMAAAAGVPGATRQSQARYEKGLASPSAAYLAVIAAAGADVHYVLTGQREGPAPMALSGEERLLLGYYREAPPAVRKAAMAALLSVGGGGQFEGSQQVFHKAPRGDVAGRDIVNQQSGNFNIGSVHGGSVTHGPVTNNGPVTFHASAKKPRK